MAKMFQKSFKTLGYMKIMGCKITPRGVESFLFTCLHHLHSLFNQLQAPVVASCSANPLCLLPVSCDASLWDHVLNVITHLDSISFKSGPQHLRDNTWWSSCFARSQHAQMAFVIISKEIGSLWPSAVLSSEGLLCSMGSQSWGVHSSPSKHMSLLPHLATVGLHHPQQISLPWHTGCHVAFAWQDYLYLQT